MNKPNDQENRAVQVALLLTEENFEREYASDGMGVVMPGVVAVDQQGQELSKIALSYRTSPMPFHRISTTPKP